MNKKSKLRKINRYLGLVGITTLTASPLMACKLLNRNDLWKIVGNSTQIDDNEIENTLVNITKGKNQLASEAAIKVESYQLNLRNEIIDQIKDNSSRATKLKNLEKITINAVSDDANGLLYVKLQFEDNTRVITIGGYETTNERIVDNFWAVFLDKDLLSDDVITSALDSAFGTKKQLPSSAVATKEAATKELIVTTLKTKVPRFQDFDKIALDQFTSNNVTFETNDSSGEISITFQNGKNERTVSVSNFLTSNEQDQANLVTTFKLYQTKINEAIFRTGAIAFQDKQKLPSEIINNTTRSSLQEEIMRDFKNQLIEPVTNLSSSQKKLLKPTMVNLQANNETGTIQISLQLTSEYKTIPIPITGFTTAIKNNETILWEVLKDDSKGTHAAIFSSLESLFQNQTSILPSEFINNQTKSKLQTEILQIMKTTVPVLKNLNQTTLNVLTPEKIILEPNDVTGQIALSFQINSLLVSSEIQISGFLSTSERQLAELWNVINNSSSLTDDAIIATGQEFFLTKTNLPSTVVNGNNESQIKKAIIANLKKDEALQNLGASVLNKLTTDLLTIAIDDQNGTITLTFQNNDQSRNVTISGFQTSNTNILWEALGNPNNFSDADFLAANHEILGKKVALPSQIIPKPKAANLIVQQLKNNVPALQNLNSKILEQLTGSDITIAHNDETGTISVGLRIGKQTRTFEITGYKKTTDSGPTEIYDIIDGFIAFFGGVDIDEMVDGVRNDIFSNKNQLPSDVVKQLTNNGTGITEDVVNSFYTNINDDGESLLGELENIREFVKTSLIFVADDTIGRVSLYLDLTKTEITGAAADYVDKTVYYLNEDGFLTS